MGGCIREMGECGVSGDSEERFEDTDLPVERSESLDAGRASSRDWTGIFQQQLVVFFKGD